MTMPDPNATPAQPDPNATPPVAPPVTPDVVPPVAVSNTPAPAHDDAPARKVGDLVVHRWHDEVDNIDHEHYGLVIATGSYTDANDREVQAARFARFDEVTGFIPLDELHSLDDEA